MVDRVRLYLMEYLYNKENYYYNDVEQLERNVHYRRADPVDHLEMVMAQTRLQTFREVSSDILKILRGWR